MDVSVASVANIPSVEGGNTITPPVMQQKAAHASGEVKTGQADKQPDREQLQAMIEDIQAQIDTLSVSVHFSTYGKDGENVKIVITEKDTGKVIREIPSEALQKLYAKMSELVGMIFSDTV